MHHVLQKNRVMMMTFVIHTLRQIPSSKLQITDTFVLNFGFENLKII